MDSAEKMGSPDKPVGGILLFYSNFMGAVENQWGKKYSLSS